MVKYKLKEKRYIRDKRIRSPSDDIGNHTMNSQVKPSNQNPIKK